MSKITVSDLEFDDIKRNLKEYFKSQSEFTDYNFEGSALSVLLDVLAYATHYNVLYDNMMVNESFLDSASKRSSVVSRANELGYTPKSATCAKIILDIKLTPDGVPDDPPLSIAIPAYTPFTSSASGKSFQFWNTEDIILNRSLSAVEYVAKDVTLYGGTPNKYAFNVTSGGRYVIPNVGIDTNTLKVVVYDNNSATATHHTFSPLKSFLSVDGDSRVYWLKEVNGMYELKFGDNLLGKSLVNGNLISTKYIIASGSEANGIRSLSYGGSTRITTGTSSSFDVIPSLTIKSPSFNGSDIESIESIKFNAPRAYNTQNRAVTAEDFKNIVLSEFSDARSVAVWGGEDNVPPVYGKVFIAIAQHSNKKLSSAQKKEVISILNGRKGFVIPEIIDAEYLNVVLNVTSYYNKLESVSSPDDIKSKILDAVSLFNTNNLQAFDKILRESRLMRVIDSADKSIVSSKFNLKLRCDVIPIFEKEVEYNVNIINPISEGTIISSGFYIFDNENMMFIDDSFGKLRLFYYDKSSNKIILNDNIGIVNYNKGYISIRGLEIVALNNGDYLTLTLTPQNKDITSALNMIVKIDNISVTVIDDKSANGDLRAGFNFQF